MCFFKSQFYFLIWLILGFPGGSDGKEYACNAEDRSLIPGSGRSPEEGKGYPLQYSCLENFMDRRTWQVTFHGGCKESDTTERLIHGKYQ